MHQCFICLEECIIPITMEKFECYKNYTIHCNSNKYSCFECYFKYSKMNNKCSICHAPSFRKDDCFQIDYKSIDENKMTSCFICNQEMTHNQLITHLFENSECLFFCTCGQFYTKNEKEEHMKQCNYFENCKICNEYHFVEDGKTFLCKKTGIHCMLCSEIICKDSHWEKTCLHRNIKCPTCKSIVKAIDFVGHYSEHVKQEKLDIQEMTEFLIQKKSEYQKHVRFLCKTFQEIYPGEELTNDKFQNSVRELRYH